MKRLLLCLCALFAACICFADEETSTSETTKDAIITIDPEAPDKEFRDVMFDITGLYRGGVLFLECQPAPNFMMISITNEWHNLIYSEVVALQCGMCSIHIGDLSAGEYKISIEVDNSVYIGDFVVR